MVGGRSIVVLVGLLAGLLGCEQRVLPLSARGDWLPAQPGPGLVAQLSPPIPDVPVPVGFVGAPRRSSATVVDRVRVVQHVYEGRAALDELVRYFGDILPTHHWEPVTSELLEDSAVMVFVKGPERLRVAIRDRGQFFELQVSIQARTNQDAGALPPAAPPPGS